MLNISKMKFLKKICKNSLLLTKIIESNKSISVFLANKFCNRYQVVSLFGTMFYSINLLLSHKVTLNEYYSSNPPFHTYYVTSGF